MEECIACKVLTDVLCTVWIVILARLNVKAGDTYRHIFAFKC